MKMELMCDCCEQMYAEDQVTIFCEQCLEAEAGECGEECLCNGDCEGCEG